jgi:hypothetical protein
MSAATLRRPVAPTLRLAFVLATVALASALLGVYIGSHQRAVIPPVPSPTERASSPTPSAAVSSPVPTPYPVITEIPGDLGLTWTSRAVSGDELWNVGLDGLWHYIDEAWTGPIVPPPLETESINRLAVGPDGALWVTSETTVAVLRDGSWSRAWGSELGVRALAVAPDGTAWVTQLHELVALRPVAAGYDAKFILCPDYMSRLAVTTDGVVYAGSFSYSDGFGGLVTSDGVTCGVADPLEDGQANDVFDIAAGPAGSLLVTLSHETPVNGVMTWDGGWTALLRDGHWSTIDNASAAVVGIGLAIDPGGHPWALGKEGLMRYGDGGWSLIAEGATSLAMAPDGVLWYQTDHGAGFQVERLRTDQIGN